MKKIIVRTGLFIAIPLLFSTCHKVDWYDVFGSQGKKDCQLQSYILDWDYDFGFPLLFEKKFNPAGDRVTEIHCSFHNVFSGIGPVPFDLRVVYKGSEVYLINKKAPFDTTLKVFLNAQGRVRECLGTGYIFRNKFFYQGNRLRALEYEGLGFHRDTCEYDSRGNILSIAPPGPPGTRWGYFYKYDYTKKAKQQFYMEETRDLNNDFTLLQYLGAFPELNPVNVRIYTRSGPEVGPGGWRHPLLNHRFDSQGRLLGYDLGFEDGDSVIASSGASLEWKCK